MREVTGDLWGFAEYGLADVVVITTNGSLTGSGAAVMGRGCAFEARKRFPGVEVLLGQYLKMYGNRPFVLGKSDDGYLYTLVTMPVKRDWKDPAIPKLIRNSAVLLRGMADARGWQSIVMPRPGCGYGQLDWDDVRPLIAPIFDDRFTVTTFAQPDDEQ